MTEDLKPTPETLEKGTFDTPQIDARTNRKAYRRLDTFQVLLRDGKIERAHNEAAQDFIKHYFGVQRRDVRVSSEATRETLTADGMPAWQWHGEKLAEAREALTRDEYTAMEILAANEARSSAEQISILQMAQTLSGYKNRDTAMGYGVRLVEGALERLAVLWGHKARPHRQ